MRPPLDRSTILITGASSGIGLELARQLAPRAGGLILVARRTERLEALRTELVGRRPDLVVSVQTCDLGDRAATDAMLARVEAEVGSIDVLINNAGMGDMGLFELADWDKVARMLELNVVALTHLTHRLLGGMSARGRGGVLQVSSGFGLEFLPGFAAYVGTKHYVTGFTEALGIEARGRGVVVSQLCPGPVATEFEELAGNFTGRKVPGWLELSAAECVRAGLRGFERGRALIVPGFAMKLLMLFGSLSPRWLKRLVYRPVAAQLRALQLRALEQRRQPPALSAKP